MIPGKKSRHLTRRLFVRNSGAIAAGLTIAPGYLITREMAVRSIVETEAKGSVSVSHGKVEIKTPYIILKLDTTLGLQAASICNRLTGNVLMLGNGNEVELDIGEPGKVVSPIILHVVDFWHDSAGDLIRFDPELFPNGFGPVKEELSKLGAMPGLWISSGGYPGMEAKQPASQPTPYARDSAIQRMDQGTGNASTELNIPAIGKDSLGIWLSRWEDWNSKMGKERWQEAMVMDICRGSMLLQIWTDSEWLTPAERLQMADFISLLKASPDCFRNSRWILGDPWKNEPYGYCCSDGNRAFLAINNACWNDSSVVLKLNPAWGLPDGKSWDIYRWYPDPVRLKGSKPAFTQSASVRMRPFEVVLLEIVQQGEKPSLNRKFKTANIRSGFKEPTVSLDFTRFIDGENISGKVIVPPASLGGLLVVIPHTINKGEGRDSFISNIPAPEALRNIDKLISGTLEARQSGKALICTQVWTDKTMAHSQRTKTMNAIWASWRIQIGAAKDYPDIEITFRNKGNQPVDELFLKGFFIPG